MSYTGSMLSSGIRHGPGTYTYRNSTFKYTGDWHNGVKHGKGKFSLGSDGPVYEGIFDNGEITGVGLKHWPNGSSYSGHFELGEMHGEGVHECANSGERYEGTFQNNRRHGKGKVTFQNGDVYNGDFVNHKFEGNGELTCTNGDKYVGEWRNNERSGLGVATWCNGDAYDGEWVDDLRHGKGVFTDGTSGISFDGHWANDQPTSSPTRAIVCSSHDIVHALLGDQEQTLEEKQGFVPNDNSTTPNTSTTEIPQVQLIEKLDSVQVHTIQPQLGIVVQNLKQVEVLISAEEREQLLQKETIGKKSKKTVNGNLDDESDIPTSRIITIVSTLSSESGRQFKCNVLKITQSGGDVDANKSSVAFVVLGQDGEDDFGAISSIPESVSSEMDHIIKTKAGVAVLGRWGVPQMEDGSHVGSYELIIEDCTPGLESVERMDTVRIPFQVTK